MRPRDVRGGRQHGSARSQMQEFTAGKLHGALPEGVCGISLPAICREDLCPSTLSPLGALASNCCTAQNPVAVERLNREINDALADPKVKARLTDRGSTVHPGTPADFAKFVGDETEKWGKVIRTAGIRAE